MNKITLSLGLVALTSTSALAGALDRTPASAGILFEEGRYVEFGISYGAPEVSGLVYGFDTENAAETFTTFSLGYKADIGNFSYALTYNTPYQAGINYQNSPVAGLKAEVDSQRLTVLGKYQLNENISVFGGIFGQNFSGILEQGAYDLDLESKTAYGYLAGVAYEIPEYAVRVALTYESEVEQDVTYTEVGMFETEDSLTLPSAITLDAQTGINERTLLFGSVRYADWETFDLTTPIGGEILTYSNPAITYNVGLGYKLSDNFSVAGSVTYEAETDSEFSFLAPTNGLTQLGFAGIYDTGTGLKIQAGVAYSMLGDAETEDGFTVFEDNSALGLGLKLSYNF